MIGHHQMPAIAGSTGDRDETAAARHAT